MAFRALVLSLLGALVPFMALAEPQQSFDAMQNAWTEKQYENVITHANVVLLADGITDSGKRITHAFRGRAYGKLKNWSACINDLNTLAPFKNNMNFYHFSLMDLGACQKKAKQYDEAITTFTKVINEAGKSSGFATDASMQLANMWEQKKEYAKAESALDLALQNDPKWAKAYRNRCFYRNQQKKWAAAERDCSQSIALEPNNNLALEWRMQARKAQKNWTGALADMDQYVALGTGNVAWAQTERGILFSKQEKWDEAIAAVSAAIANNPDRKWGWSNRSLYYRTTGKYDLALSDANRALGIDPKYYFAHKSKVLCLLKMQKWTQMRDASSAWVRAFPDRDLGYFYRGFAKEKLNDIAGARADFETVIRIDPKDEDALGNLGITYFNEEKYKTAYEFLIKAVEYNPNNQINLSILGRTLNGLQRYSEAIPYLEQAIERGAINTWTKNALKLAKKKLPAENFDKAQDLLKNGDAAGALLKFKSLLKEHIAKPGGTTDKDYLVLNEAIGVSQHRLKQYCAAAQNIAKAQNRKQISTYVNLITPAFECAGLKKTNKDITGEMKWAMAAIEAGINAQNAGKKDGLIGQMIGVVNNSYAKCQDEKWATDTAKLTASLDLWNTGTSIERAVIFHCFSGDLGKHAKDAVAKKDKSIFANYRGAIKAHKKKAKLSPAQKTAWKEVFGQALLVTKKEYKDKKPLTNANWKKWQNL